MPTPIDPKRLPRLRAALESVDEEESWPQQKLADLYGVANSRMTTLIKQRFESFPEAERHQDKTHWFKARPAIASMIAYLERKSAGRKQAAARAAAVTGGAAVAADQAPAEEPPPMGPVELDRLASAATRIWRLQIEQGKYLPAAQVRQRAREWLSLVKSEIGSIPSAVDPHGELDPLARARLEKRSRAILVKIHDKMEALLGSDDDADEGMAGSSAAAA